MGRKEKTMEELQAENKKLEKKAKKGKGGIIGGTVVALAALALLALKGAGFGFGDGGLLKSKSNDSTNESTATPAADEKNEPSENDDPSADGKVEIIVSEGGITADGKAIADAAALKDFILEVNKDDLQITLKDDKAIKADYDAVKAVLDELKLEYSENAD